MAQRTIVAGFGLLLLTISPMAGQNPSTSDTFEQVVSGMQNIRWYDFRPGGGLSNLNALAQYFNPYGIAGTTPTHYEWERYQEFNPQNFAFSGNGLDLTATINGGLYEGGINSGQIWTKDTYKPGVTGATVYGFMVRMKVPKGVGMWAQSWLYPKEPGQNDGSEIDNPEILSMNNQNSFDWTGFDHGPNAGSDIYSIKSNPWVWHPGYDFSDDYHNFQLIWTPNATYKYVDGRLIQAQNFVWSAPGAGQFGVAMAVGSSEPGGLPGLMPNCYCNFPAVLSVQYIGIWAK
jgi:Glycosyl hydrolases family 16